MRKRLLDAAVKVIMSRGYLGFTTLEAAKVAGVTRGAVHHHFRNSDGFLLAALEHFFAETQRISERTITHLTKVSEILSALAADAQRFYFSQGFFAGLDVLLSATKDARSRMAVRELGNRYRIGNEEMWRDHLVAQGVARRDAETAVWMLLSIVRGFGIRTMLKHDPARIQELIQLELAMVLRFLEERQSFEKKTD
ncbi:MAG: TetR/AcrR family transcriptional regulator [Alphaproteobacteria bacterium]